MLGRGRRCCGPCYRRPLRAGDFGDLVVVMSGLADFSDKVLKFTHFLFDAELRHASAACAEAVGMKFDQKIRKIMTFSAEDQARLAERKLRLLTGDRAWMKKTKTAAGIAAGPKA